MFERVLVANRGEIAVRIAETARRLGAAVIGVHTPADAGARHVRELDESVLLPAGGYLDAGAVVAAALRTGAQAVHPGYGFLAESPSLARACESAGIAFVGPRAEVIELMGDKVAARAAAEAAGVPVLPGLSRPGLTDAELREAASGLGFPLMLKPAAGGGGKGMRVVHGPGDLDAALLLARNEARAAFADDTLFLERFLERARHVEVQVLADAHGGVVHLGTRDCSLQRRQQKIVEEAPAPELAPAVSAAMCEAAVALARSCGYTGAGTVELIAPLEDLAGFSFLEMNTRLQVEHRVTEAVYGLDLVEWQLRVACGERLPFHQQDLVAAGHAVEARWYAEDPGRGFLPTGGPVLLLRAPRDEAVLLDRSVDAGDVVGTDYDPLLAKVVARAERRGEAVGRLRAALARAALLGVVTNQALLLELLSLPEFVAGRPDTGLVERFVAGAGADPGGSELLAAASVAWFLTVVAGPGSCAGGARTAARGGRGGAMPAAEDPWDDRSGWRLGAPAPLRLTLRHRGGGAGTGGAGGEGTDDVSLLGDPRREALAEAGGRTTVVTGARFGEDRSSAPGGLGRGGPAGRCTVALDGVVVAFDVALEPPRAPGAGRLWLSRLGRTAVFELVDAAGRAAAPAGGVSDGLVRSPMPGVVREIAVSAGERVRREQLVAVVEAMKMQHPLRSPLDGAVREVLSATGDRVELDQVLVVVAPAGGGEAGVGEAGVGEAGVGEAGVGDEEGG